MSGSSQGIFSQLAKLPPATADSDAQVGLGIPSSFTKPSLSGHFLYTGRYVLFPINSRQALFFHFYGEPNTELVDREVQQYNATAEDVFTINKDTYDQADEKIFCNDKKYLQWFIEHVGK